MLVDLIDWLNEFVITSRKMASSSEHILTLLVALQQGADKRVTYKFIAFKNKYVPMQTARRM